MTALFVAAGVLVPAAAAAALTVVRLRRRYVVVGVEGNSMEPTLGADERVIVHRVRPSALQVGDIVVFERPTRDAGGESWAWRSAVPDVTDRHWMIKRLVALPGDPAPEVMPAGAGPVPSGALAVLGDNRAASIDSRTFGYVPLDRLLGVAVRRFAQDGPITAETRPAASWRNSPFRPRT
ncbi:S26 family signal peptidase [Actinoplanes utahensis]|uniref:S26 family signal peptidase n=1 Tax=Actinoplanes utahensis TaxID=1869 RepID=UPI00068F52EC|nr:S26 family signal peptidase [Actinoplanes utahensis]GIF35074.1 hypothetical protein Aut01nite_80600 [Actinoplanes utahensis]